jgi:hypothetical protein
MDAELRRTANEYQELLQGRQRLRDAPADFKARVVALTARFSKTMVAQVIGINPSTLRRWCLDAPPPTEERLPAVSVTKISAASLDLNVGHDLEVISVRGERVRIPCQGDAIERVLAFVLERG